ncbi:uncharacterized protein LOC107270976 isoform X1 [Cephus cinctus]|uniref:Uncharacterized protein LOC107270976 isoform X1 n=1 Tax=Cephus cinctus TaxID=211228 RepID=A0AAJ7C5K3_CEPCN|nr:uncharacterized protein LOC107270976 isoform X1 [Cephus cinctus]
MNFQNLLVLVIVLVELAGMLDAYKYLRRYKYYRPRPRYRPRWHHPGRPKYYPRREPGYYNPRPYYRYPATYENPVDYAVEEQPYTIEIELPKGHGQSGTYSNGFYHRDYNTGLQNDYIGDDDYLDDDDDDSRIFRAGKKKVQIKVVKGAKPKLRIKIARDDNLTQLNITEADKLLGPEVSTNLKEIDDPLEEEWVPSNPVPSYPKFLRGA